MRHSTHGRGADWPPLKDDIGKSRDDSGGLSAPPPCAERRYRHSAPPPHWGSWSTHCTRIDSLPGLQNNRKECFYLSCVQLSPITNYLSTLYTNFLSFVKTKKKIFSHIKPYAGPAEAFFTPSKLYLALSILYIALTLLLIQYLP
jgi:hypothetical protein